MIDLNSMSTEQRNDNTVNLDTMSILDALKTMNTEDVKVAEAVAKELCHIEKAVKAVINSFESGGRLIYLGAGTSGRLGLLDAVECPPTFGTDPEMVVGIIAGGEGAFIRAVEGAEDSSTMGIDDLQKIDLKANDTVIGIAASGRTPYVLSALQYAKEIGCTTVAVSCNKNSPIGKASDIAIEVVVGPEVLTGSTRLKAGTAQKMVLNMISTISMVGIGKVYKNLMVDVQQTNIKLQSRAINIITNATGVEGATAKDYLQKAKGSVKLAITMILLNCGLEEAVEKLNLANGHIKNTLK